MNKTNDQILICKSTYDIEILLNSTIPQIISGISDSPNLYFYYLNKRKKAIDYQSNHLNSEDDEKEGYLSHNLSINRPKELYIKWHIDTQVKSYFQTNYCNLIFNKSLKDHLELKEYKDKLDRITEMNQIETDFKQKYIVTKILFNPLLILSEINIDECLETVINFNKTTKANFTDDSKLLYFFRTDIVRITTKISTLMNNTKDKAIQKKLLDIVYYLSLKFKSLYAMLFLLHQLKEFQLEYEYQLPQPFATNQSCFESGFLREGLLIEEAENIQFQIEDKELNFNECSLAFYQDIIYIFNKGLLTKHILLNTRSDSLIKLRSYQLECSKKRSIKVFQESLLISFSFDDFKRNSNLFEVFDLITLQPIKSNDIIEYDSIAKEMLFSYENKSHYYTSSGDVIIQDHLEYSDSNCGICLQEIYLYIILPIKKINTNDEGQKKKYLSSSYIYAIDIFTITYKDNKILISFKESQVISMNDGQDIEPGIYPIDEMFTSNNSIDKFIMINGLIVSGEGIAVYDTKLKSVINDKTKQKVIKINKEDNSILIAYYYYALYLIKNKADNVLSFKYYRMRSFQDYIFHYAHPLYKEIISINTKIQKEDKEKTLNDINGNSHRNNDNYLQDIFASGENNNSKSQIQLTPTPSLNMNSSNSKNFNISIQLLSSLLKYFDDAQFITVNEYYLPFLFVSPYILNADLPTLTLFLELIEKSISSQLELFVYIHLLQYHVVQIFYIHSFTFFELKSNDLLLRCIGILFKVKEKYPNTFDYNITNILFILMNRLDLSNKEIEEIITNLFNEKLKSIELLSSSYHSVYKYFCYIINSNDSIQKAFQIPKNIDYIKQIMAVLISHNFNSERNNPNAFTKANSNIFKIKSLTLMFHTFFQDFILHGLLSNINYIQVIDIIYSFFAEINENLDKLNDDNALNLYSFPFSLLCYVLNLIIKQFNSIGKEFSFVNWSILLEIMFKLSELKTKKTMTTPPNEMYDVIIDNYDFIDQANSKQLIKLNLPLFSSSTSSSVIKSKLYIEAMYINEKNKIKNKKIMAISTIKNKKELFALYINNYSNVFNKTYQCIDFDSKDQLMIDLETNTSNSLLLKIRISNYLFYNEKIGDIIDHCSDLFNLVLSQFAFFNSYEKKDDEELQTLLTRRMFQKGLNIDNINNKKIKEYISMFTTSLNNSFYSILLSPLIQRELDKIKLQNTSSQSSLMTSEGIESLLNSTKYNALIHSINEANDVDIDNEDEKKSNIIKYSFYAILYHENILHLLDLDLNKNDRKYINDVYLMCTKLGGIYELMKKNNMNTDDILPKLAFLFKLIPETKYSSSQSTSYPSLRIIKDNVKSIAFFIQNELLSIESIFKTFEFNYIAIAFRSISLIILKNVINKYSNNNEEKSKLLANYYHLFTKNSSGFPSIYSGLKYINEENVNLLTQSFNDLIYEIILQINTKKLSRFTLCTYFSFLQWKLNEYNSISSFDISRIIGLMNNDNDTNNAYNKFIFISLKPSNESYGEIRVIDYHIIGKLLSDTFCNYTHEYIKCKTISKANKASSIRNIMNKYKLFFDDLLKQLTLITINNDKDKPRQANISFFYSMNQSPIDGLQTKINNLLFEFNKIVLAIINNKTDNDDDISFNDQVLWKYIILLLPYLDEKRTMLVFSLLKIYSINYKDDMHNYYSVITEKTIEKNTYSNELLFEYLYTKSKYNQYTFDYFLYWYFNIEKGIINYIIKKITDHNEIQFMSCFGCNVNEMYYHQDIIANCQLCLETMKINTKPNQTELNENIFEGYYIADYCPNISSKSTESKKTIKYHIRINENEEVESQRANEAEEDNENDEYNNRDNEDNEEDQNNLNKNNSLNIKSRNRIVKDQLILLKKSKKGNSLLYLSNVNEIICNNNYYSNTDSNRLPISKEIIQFCFDKLESSLFNKETLSFQSNIFIIQIIKCLIQHSNQYSNIINPFLEKNRQTIDLIVNAFTPVFEDIILPKEKIEEYFHKSVNDLPLEARQAEEKINLIVNKMKNNQQKVCIRKLVNFPTGVLEIDQIEQKIIVPVIEYSLPSYDNVKKQFLVITLKEYEEIMDETKQDIPIIKKENYLILLCREVILLLQNKQANIGNNEIVIENNNDANNKDNNQDKLNDQKDNIEEDQDWESFDDDENQKETKTKKKKKTGNKNQNQKNKKQDGHIITTEEKSTEAWNQFVSKISSHFNTLNCYLLFESFEQISIPNTIGWISYPSEYIPTSHLSNNNICDIISTQYNNSLIESKSSFETLHSVVAQSKDNKDTNTNHDNESQLLIKLAQEEISKAIKAKNKLDHKYINYFDLINQFPTLASFKALSLTKLHTIGLFLIQYYLRLLLLSQNKPINLSSLMLMHYITSYYHDYFNLQFEYNIVYSGIVRQIDSIDINHLIQTTSTVTTMPLIKSENDFKKQYSKQFLLDIIQIYISNNNTVNLNKIINSILSSNLSYFNNKIEHPILLFDIIQLILEKQFSKELIDLLMQSTFLEQANQLIQNNYINKVNDPMRFALYEINHFLLSLMILIKSKSSCYQDIEIKFDYMNTLYKYYDIFVNKLASPLLFKEVCLYLSEEYKEKKEILELPLIDEPFLIRYCYKDASGFYLSKHSSLSNSIICGIKSVIKSINDESNSFILSQDNKESYIEGNDILIIKDRKSSLINQLNNNKHPYIEFTEFNNFNRIYDIGKDINGIYYKVEDGITKHKSLNELAKTEKIVHFGKNVVTTNKGLYIFNKDNLSKNITKINSDLYQIAFPENEIVIGSFVYSNVVIAWTESGKLYGFGSNSEKIIMDSHIEEITQFTEIKLPKNTKAVDAATLYNSCLVYQVLDLTTQTMRFFVNGYTYDVRIFDNSDYSFGREIEFLKDKRAIKMFLVNYFFIVFCEGGDIYYRGTTDYGPNGIHKAEEFKRLGLNVINVTISGNYGVLIDCKRQIDNKRYFYVVGSKSNSKKNSFDNPLLLNNSFNSDLCLQEHKRNIFKVIYYFTLNEINCIKTVYTSPIKLVEDLFNKSKLNKSMKVICYSHKDKKIYEITLVNCIEIEKKVLLWFDIKTIEECDDDIKALEDQKQLYTFIDKSDVVNQNHPNIIRKLYQFSKVFKSIKQLGILIKEKTDKKLNSLCKLYKFNHEPNTASSLSITHKINREDLFKTERKLFNNITEADILKYIRDKNNYEKNDKSSSSLIEITSFHSHLIKTNQNNKQFPLFSSMGCLTLLDAICKIIEKAGNVLYCHFGYKEEKTWLINEFKANLHFMNRDIKNNSLKQGLAIIPINTKEIQIIIDRETASRNKRKQIKDEYYQWSIFSQLYYSFKTLDESIIFIKHKKKKLLQIITINEKESYSASKKTIHQILCEAFNELTSSTLDLFIIDEDNDHYTINPSANTTQHLELFEFIGKLFAFLIINELYVSLRLSPSVWKNILYLISDYNSSNMQIKAIQNGLFNILERKLFLFLSWEELENTICGSMILDVDKLKRMTIYERYTLKDKTIQYFWKFIETCSQEYQSLYCQFVKGQRNILFKENDKLCVDYHTIRKQTDKNQLPKGIHSKFLFLLPEYNSYEELRKNMCLALMNK